MFEIVLLILSLIGAQVTAYEDCTISVDNAPAPIIRAVDEWNDIPDEYRDCSGSLWRWAD
jgi:hypothetical protein